MLTETTLIGVCHEIRRDHMQRWETNSKHDHLKTIWIDPYHCIPKDIKVGFVGKLHFISLPSSSLWNVTEAWDLARELFVKAEADGYRMGQKDSGDFDFNE